MTKNQSLVLELDSQGLTPSQIAARTGISPQQVCNLKKRLRAKGYHARVLTKLRTKIDPSDIGTDADELPDPDEPTAPVARCECGLVLPCYHEPVSVWQNRNSDDRYEDMDGVVEASVENHHRRPRRSGNG